MALQMKWMEKEQFEKLTMINGNRPLNPKKYNSFLKGIRQNNGILPETKQWPITVNAKNQIVDGQNHWYAVMLWNERHTKNPIKKIPYFLDPDGDLNTAKIMNDSDERWKDSERIYSWKNLGHADFGVLEEILSTKNAKILGRGIVYKICGDPEIKNIHKTIVDGSFKMWRDREDAEKMIAWLADVKSELTRVYGKSDIVVPIFLACTQIPRIDMEHFCKQLKNPPVKITYSISTDEVLKTFTRVYNSGEGSRSRKYLDITERYNIVKGYNSYQDVKQDMEPRLREDIKNQARKNAQKKIDEARHNAMLPGAGPDTDSNTNPIKSPSLFDDGIVPV